MKKTLVLLSGGMDSATALAVALSNGVAQTVSFDYGQRHSKELLSAMKLAEHYRVESRLLNLRGAWSAFAGSALTASIQEDVAAPGVPDGHYADETMKLTVVPNRNMILLSLAAGYAIAQGCTDLMYAAHAGDHAIYPDCRPEFAGLVGACIKIGNYDGPTLRAPFIEMTKAEIAKMGHILGVPYELTWSCYKGGDIHCGTCGTCVERKEAFELAEVKDPTVYL